MTEVLPLNGMRILIVEDEYFLADDLRVELLRQGAEICGPVASVAAAMDIVRAGQLDGAILDINLGEELSLPVADALAGDDTPFVLATGYDEWVIPVRFTAVPRIEKPFGPGQAIAELKKAIAQRAR